MYSEMGQQKGGKTIWSHQKAHQKERIWKQELPKRCVGMCVRGVSVELHELPVR